VETWHHIPIFKYDWKLLEYGHWMDEYARKPARLETLVLLTISCDSLVKVGHSCLLFI
jgi:hypothetical protein